VVLFLLGLSIMFIGPFGYYRHFNRYVDRVEERGLTGGGLGWVAGYNQGRNTLDLLTFTATAHLYSWEWPRVNLDGRGKINDEAEINPQALRWLKISGISLFTLLLLGLIPWPRKWTAFAGTDPLPPAEPALLPGSPGEGLGEGDFRSIPNLDDRNSALPYGKSGSADSSAEASPAIQRPQPSVPLQWPLALMIVLAWIVVPVYATYCASVDKYVSPLEGVAGLLLKDMPRVEWPTRDEIGWWPFSDGVYVAKWGTAWRNYAAQFHPGNFRVPTTGLHWAMLAGGAAIAVCAFILSGRSNRQRIYKLAVLWVIVLTLFVLCMLVYAFYVRRHDGSVWMPRYLGMIWPAVGIVVAVLLLRLPTRPLRFTAIGLLVGLNLAVFGARFYAGTEPPTDRMAQDLIDSQPDDATVRMYYGIRADNRGAPGMGYLWSVPGAYYLTIISGKPTNPSELITAFHGGRNFNRKFKRWTSMLPLPQYIATDVRRDARLRQIIVWDDYAPAARPDPSIDTVTERLGDAWHRTAEETFAVYDHWTWRQLRGVRRRVYERTSVPDVPPLATPATLPATIPGAGS
jgi:hypothetical protein